MPHNTNIPQVGTTPLDGGSTPRRESEETRLDGDRALELDGDRALELDGDRALELDGVGLALSTADTRPSTVSRRVSKRQKASVLLACSVLQIPIWGFAMTYGIFQEYYEHHPSFSHATSTVGVIGTTQNGVMYLSMPLLFALFCRRYAHFRRHAALLGVLVACTGFLAAGFCSAASGLVVTQGVVAALGCALIYSPTTLVLSEVFGHEGRAVAYGVVLSAKNVTGSGSPFFMRWLLERYGLRVAMVVWCVVVGFSGFACVVWMPMRLREVRGEYRVRERRIPWGFLRERAFWVYAVAIVLQSSGYGIPQTYLSAYAHSVLGLKVVEGTMLITLFNAPGILASSFFGWVSDNRWKQASAMTTTLFSAMMSGLAALLLWGLAGKGGSLVMLIFFAVIYGFFAGGYSATWGGIIKEMEDQAAERNEAIDTGMVYGLLNGARGIGYVGGGLAGVQLLKAGNVESIGRFGYGTVYGPLIVYTGLSTLMGGCGILLRCKRPS